jgi:hypothetical protein
MDVEVEASYITPSPPESHGASQAGSVCGPKIQRHGPRPAQTKPDQKTTAGASAANGRERASEQDEASIPPLPFPALQILPYPSPQARKPYAFQPSPSTVKVTEIDAGTYAPPPSASLLARVRLCYPQCTRRNRGLPTYQVDGDGGVCSTAATATRWGETGRSLGIAARGRRERWAGRGWDGSEMSGADGVGTASACLLACLLGAWLAGLAGYRVSWCRRWLGRMVMVMGRGRGASKQVSMRSLVGSTTQLSRDETKRAGGRRGCRYLRRRSGGRGDERRRRR